ncbi:unnamed protein product [Ilex paraguariensis]|uniref:Secreted protein n=1 Tax=Ilex paraguariensis TaxID=185542 RepID=A0ABC8T7D8_9AQUA
MLISTNLAAFRIKTMASFSPKSTLVTLMIFAIVFSPMLSSEAARFTHRELLQRPPLCPACVCCEPPPPGSCCRCCATTSPISFQSETQTP